MTKEKFWILFMKNKLQLQDFTYLINILKDKDFKNLSDDDK